jgi:hypothetical protein
MGSDKNENTHQQLHSYETFTAAQRHIISVNVLFGEFPVLEHSCFKNLEMSSTYRIPNCIKSSYQATKL